MQTFGLGMTLYETENIGQKWASEIQNAVLWRAKLSSWIYNSYETPVFPVPPLAVVYIVLSNCCCCRCSCLSSAVLWVVTSLMEEKSFRIRDSLSSETNLERASAARTYVCVCVCVCVCRNRLLLVSQAIPFAERKGLVTLQPFSMPWMGLGTRLNKTTIYSLLTMFAALTSISFSTWATCDSVILWLSVIYKRDEHTQHWEMWTSTLIGCSWASRLVQTFDVRRISP